MIRVNVHAPVSALHDAGNELLGMKSVILAGEDFPNRPPVAMGKPGHAFRMDVQFPDPPNARHRAFECFVDRIRVILIAGIMGRLMGGALPRSPHGQHHVTGRCDLISAAWFSQCDRLDSGNARPEERHTGFKSIRGVENQRENLVKDLPGNKKLSHFGLSSSVKFIHILCSDDQGLGKRVLGGVPNVPFS